MELRQKEQSPIHPLEGKAGAANYQPNPNQGHNKGAKQATSSSHQQGLKKRSLAYVDVFVDHFAASDKTTQ
jgi:hypothetical protein